jgi:DNA repair protein RadC
MAAQTVNAAGHRARLLDRYTKAGIASLSDYEILELLLTFALPRIDTKPLAKSLLAAYGSVSAVVNAPLDELCAIDGLGKRSAALFTLIRDTISFCLGETYAEKSVIRHRGDIEEYLRFHFGHRREEFAAAVFLDGASNIIGTDIVAEGTVNRCFIYPRKVMESAIRRGAAAFILAHNHPAGTTTPSEADWELTERLMETGRCMDVPLMDHIIITKDRTISLREYDRWPVVPATKFSKY